MFFAPPDVYEPSGLFGVAHGMLLFAAVLLIGLGLYVSHTLSPRGVRRVIRIATALLWVLEAGKIAFVLGVVGTRNPNEYVPLYYCSITLYAGALSSLCHGFWRRVGDIFLSTGGLFGGAVFLLVPLTSLTRYPAFHFITWHSFVLHGLMVYLGLLLLMRGVYRAKREDILYCAGIVSVACFAAALFNALYDRAHPDTPVANLMFISKDFPGTPISLLYHLCGPLYPTVVWLGQAILPFLLVCGIQGALLARRNRRSKEKL